MRAVGDFAQVRLRYVASPLLVFRNERFFDGLGFVPFEQGDGRAAETTARQPGTEHARQLLGDLHQRVEFRRAVLEVVARTFVAGKHERAEAFDVAAAKELDAAEHALVFTHNVRRTSVGELGKGCRARFELGAGDVTERFGPEPGRGVEALQTALVVFAPGESVGHAALGDEQLDAVRERRRRPGRGGRS